MEAIFEESRLSFTLLDVFVVDDKDDNGKDDSQDYNSLAGFTRADYSNENCDNILH